jgi:glycosyltransferase involved in cell wall biosynthesis
MMKTQARALKRSPCPDTRPSSTKQGKKRIVVLASLAESLISFRGPLLHALVARGHEVITCAPEPSPAIVEKLGAAGVICRQIPLDRQGLTPRRDLTTLAALVLLLRKLQPDIVLSYTIKPVIYGMLAARLAGVPQRYAMITGVGYAFMGRSFKHRLTAAAALPLYRTSLAGAQRVFFQNPDDRALFERLRLIRRPEQVEMINGSGVDLEAFRPAPLPEHPSFLLLARLLEDKGIREYAAAARIVRTRYPGVAFRLAGWFDDNPAALRRRELESWTAEGVIEFLGRLDDVRPAIAACAVYVLPSYREGTPRTVLEAMAMGRPIITTDAPGCRESVRPDVNGYLVPVGDVRLLARAMERFLEQPELISTMGRASRELAVEKYDVHKVNAVILRAMGLEQ